jgi:hypothetical protein
MRIPFFAKSLALFLWLPAAFAADAVVLAGGDIADCGVPGAALTAKLILGTPATVLAVGDLAYPNGGPDEFRRCYGATWGRFRGRTWPVPGNHEYRTAGASGYFGYFGSRAGEPGKGYYSVELGDWHVVALNSSIDAGPESEQMRWLRRDLAENRRTCVLAFFHYPRFSSGEHGDNGRMAAVWETLYAHGASVVLSGHDHHYERFAPLDATGQPDEKRGIRSFVVGSAGATLYGLHGRREHSEAANGTTWGVLKLTLHPGSYDWEFLPVAGGQFNDAGSARCVGG